MRRSRVSRSQGQIINNFFTIVTIVIMTAVIVLYSKYVLQPKAQKAKINSGLACQESHYTADKLFEKALIKESITLLQEGNYVINGGFILSEHMPTAIEKKIALKDIDKLFLDTIKTEQNKNVQKFLNIKYEVIENDKNDPGKKNESCKLNAGSLLTSFRLNGKEVYRMYTDFNQSTLNEINERVTCTMEAFKYNAKL
ncbi:MAG: hypothetical protein ACNI3C_00735 [Candidatus Marinarcus sp.]|uniref:hypothetical protein n=1 Tax=Candidatus Marinarcus sp. TaxID=3100987 RepID=UPI003AFFABDE